MTQILQIAALAAATFGTGAVTLSVMNEDVPDFAVPEGAWAATGALDGKTFRIYGEDSASGAVLEDDIVFQNGTFQSTDCENYCNFGWSDYRTKTIDGVIHFTSTAICPNAPHTVVWYGRVSGDDVVIDGTWTTRRWYWTNQIEVHATGSVIPGVEVAG